MFKKLVIISALVLTSTTLSAQSSRVKDFSPVCDSLNTLIQERTSVKGKLQIRNIIKRGTALDFYFTESLSDIPWKAADMRWFKQELVKLFPASYRSYRLGEIYSKGIRFSQLKTTALGNSGDPVVYEYRTKDPKGRVPMLVTNLDAPTFDMGMSGRTIALWQSHGRYFDQNARAWKWQRPCLFTTSEDLFTQGFVLDFLVPMLENAGAYTMLPRERDTQRQEYIIDNDPYSTAGSSRLHGDFKTRGKWQTCGTGFADSKPVYTDLDNPFKTGTTLKIKNISPESKSTTSTVEWIPAIKEKGSYAVYVSYQSLPESTEHALYKVVHNGGTTRFSVNQKISGGTWVYLGTFTFAPDCGHKVVLENRVPEGCGENGRTVTADAVKIGGGMGNIARKNWRDADSTAQLSGLPRYLEGARYWLQWAGIDEKVWNQFEQKNDYKDDFMSRGPWVEYMTGGSYVNPKMEGKKVPVDLSFALHSDAGVTPGDSIIGTLAIYTYKSDNKTRFPDGESRMNSREYADLVQSQLVNDIRTDYDSLWSRRHIWDRYYNESRRPSCPAMLLEFLSHQNFADMRYGLDPSFRFTVGRSIYKGMLKYLSNRYETPYVVQPLPVHDFSMTKMPGENIVILKWRATEDRLEPTADAENFILETRVDDGSFDNGRIIGATKTQEGIWLYPVRLKPGRLYSFRLRACNAGGKSFPSEVLSAGIPDGKDSDVVLVVNNFDRVAAPVWFDTPDYAGFDARTDRGVPYRRDITYMGDMYEFRRDKEWVTNDNGGFGACYRDYTGKTVAGNSFDYPAVHGKAIMAAGHAFVSSSASAFVKDDRMTDGIWAVDMICGKQVTTVSGKGHMPARFQVFPEEMQERIGHFTRNGGNLLISGSNIATDVWDSVYPIEKDSIFTEVSKKFTREVLGFSWGGNHAGRLGKVVPTHSDTGFVTGKTDYNFYTEPNPHSYCVESPDGILPARTGAKTIFRYADTEVSAGIRYDRGHYRTVVLGFPIETLKDEKEIGDLVRSALDWFRTSQDRLENECKTGRADRSH